MLDLARKVVPLHPLNGRTLPFPTAYTRCISPSRGKDVCNLRRLRCCAGMNNGKRKSRGKSSGSSFIQKWRGRTAYRESLKRMPRRCPAGRKAALHNLPRGCSPARTAFCPLNRSFGASRSARTAGRPPRWRRPHWLPWGRTGRRTRIIRRKSTPRKRPAHRAAPCGNS